MTESSDAVAPDATMHQEPLRFDARHLHHAGSHAGNAPVATTTAEPNQLLSLSFLQSAAAGATVTGCALVAHCELSSDRTGRPYLALTLQGADGVQFAARWWRYPYPAERRPVAGQICSFTGMRDSFGGAVQLRVAAMRRAPEVDAALFTRTTRRPVEELHSELETHIEALDPALRALVRAVLSGDVLERYCRWPAAQSRHGAVRHGLLAHSLRVTQLAHALAQAYGAESLP